MAYEPERVVIELLAKTTGLDTVEPAAAKFERSMDKIETSATKAESAVSASSRKTAEAVAKDAGSAELLARKIEAFEKRKATAYQQGVKSLVESGKISDGSRRASVILAQRNVDAIKAETAEILRAGQVVTSSSSPFVAPVRQAPAVSRSFTLLTGAASALGGVLGGILVTGAIAGAEALYKMLTASKDTASEIDALVEKLKENAEKSRLADSANLAFGFTIEGVTAALDANEKILKKLNDQSETAARRALEEASAQEILARRLQATAVARLEDAKSQLETLRTQALQNGGSLRETGVNASIGDVEARIKSLTAQIEKSGAAIDRAINQKSVALAQRVVELVQAQSDPLEAIKVKYDAQIEAAKKRAIAEGTVETKLAGQVRQLEKQKAAALEVERARKRAADAEERAGRQSGRQITEADARRIVAGLGGTVTSGFRTPEKNRSVDGAANSFHLKGQAIDIAKTAGLTLGKIVQAFEKEGVKLIEKLDEGDHFHIAFSKRGGKGTSAETIAKRAQAAADAEERRAQAYANELASLQDQEIDARQALITSAEEIARLELDAIEISRQKYAANVASLVDQRKLKDEEAKELLKLNEERAKLRKELVQRREDERKFRLQEQQAQNAVELQQAKIRNESDILQAQLGLADTRKQRAALERRLLDLQFQEERIALQAIINYNERLKLQQGIADSERIEAEAAAQIAKIKLESLEKRQGLAIENNEKQNASPLDQYFGNVREQAGDINDAFESIAAGGLATFTDALTDAIVNFRSLGDVGRAVLQNIVAGLVKLAIQQVILATIGKALGKGATAASAAEGTAVATAWAPAAANVALATLGAAAGPAAAALAGTHALSAALSAAGSFTGAAGKAGGGRIYGPGSSTSDDVPIWASRDEFMIRAKSARSLGYDTLEHINRTGKLPGFANGGRIRSIAPMNMPAAAPGARGGGFRAEDIGALRGVISEAVAAGINAMPDVNNYIGFDAAALLVRALGTREGQRALVNAYGRNKTAIQAQR